jgi:uncharacterized protein (TIGR03086 family)
VSVASLHERSVEAFSERVRAIQPGSEWDLPTPCTEWSVRDLVNHVAYGDLWVRPLLEGKTLEEVGDRFEGDVLGDDPVAGYERAAEDALAAVSQADLAVGKVHTSGGVIDASEYVSQRTMDNLIHAWDVARAIGASEDFDLGLVTFVLEMFEPHGGGPPSMFAAPVEVPDDGGDELTKLLALTGRRM